MTFLAFGGLDSCAAAHKHTKKRLDSNKLPLPQRDGRCSFVEQIIRRGAVAIAARYSHSVHCAIIIEVSGVHTAQHTRGIRDCSLDASLRQRPIWPAR